MTEEHENSGTSKGSGEARCYSTWLWAGKGLASLAVCGMGAYCMFLTGGTTGIGWAILGIMLIWAS